MNDSNKLIEFVKYFFNNEIDSYTSSSIKQELITRCLFFDSNEEDFIIRLLEAVNKKSELFYFQNELSELISKINKNSLNKVFEHLLENHKFKEISYELSKLTNEENIQFIYDKLNIDKSIEDSEIEYFRNRLSNRSERELGRKFNQKMISQGFKFKEEFLDDIAIENLKLDFQSKPQKNFDILFKSDELLNEIKLIFEKYGDFIDKEIFYKINQDWYETNGHWNKLDTSIEILRRLIYRTTEHLDIDYVAIAINSENFIIEEIKSDIENNDKSNNTFSISDYQAEFIKNWVEKTIENIDFSKLIEHQNIDSFSLLSDYNKWELIIYFTKKFNFNIQKEFLLKSLDIPSTRSFSSDNGSLFEFLVSKVNDKVSVDKKVVENLYNENLNAFTLNSHIKYALDNKLKVSYKDIRRHFLNQKYEYNLKVLLISYNNNQPNDIDLLKECASDIKKYKCWDAISLLMDKGIEEDFCKRKAIDYLDRLDEDVNRNFVSNSLSILFRLNAIEALDYYMKHIGDDFMNFSRAENFNNYDVINDYKIIIDFFDKIYLDKKFERSFSSSTNFLNQYISNLSKSEEKYKEVMNVLLNKREELKKSNENNGIFHINLLIDMSENSYYLSKSKPLTFSQALAKVKEILN